MLEINVKITVGPGEKYTPVESAVIEALQSASSIGTTQTTEATVRPQPAAPAPAAAAEAAAAEAPAAPAPKAAPKRGPKAAAAPKPSTGPAVLEDDATDDKMDADAREAHDAKASKAEPEEDLVGAAGDAAETEYTVQDAVALAQKIVKEKDGRARLKVALAEANKDHDTAYATVGVLDGPTLQAFMAKIGA